ncbi:MAG: LCP family protein [Candidatus Gastranaerophilales bacterium]|nr:LCP family protein [Candidatus Gastranaerophilales bacterium]
MNKKELHSRNEEEYTAFLKHIREEREYTSNFAKSLLTFVLGVCCVLALGLWLVQKESLVVRIFGKDTIISRQLLAIGNSVKSHTRSTKSWSIFGRQQNILLLGVDSNGNGTDMWKGTRSDTIIVINVDPSVHSVNAISIPRDSKVYLPGNHGTDKINAAHAFGGVEMTKKTVEDTLGIKIERYICIHDEGVREVIDAIGGIPIYVEKRMKYDDYAGKLHINLEKGNQVLSGQQAIGYLRFRHDGLGDIGRTQRQQWFLRGLLERLQSPQTISKIPEIVGIAKKYIKTDMSVYELSQLAAMAKGIDEGSVQVAMLPGRPSSKGGLSYWILDPDKVQDVVNRLIYREDTNPDKSAQLIAGILFTSSQAGKAKELRTQLNNLGYTVNMMQSGGLPHTQFIAHNTSVSDSFYKYLKEKIPAIGKIQYVYDPIKLFCVGNSDFTIVLSGR